MPMTSERTLKPIRSDREHEAALAEIARMMNRTDLTPAEVDRLEILETLAEAYDKERYPLGLPADPIVALKSHMEMTGKTQADLAALLGSRSRASEILSEQTRLSLSMIRKLSEHWGLPAEILIREVEITAERPKRYRTKSVGGVQRLNKRVKK
jgi:HTH-type transcriptional regulator/antitoxin HigA